MRAELVAALRALAEAERDMAAMTADLVAAQDQLLALSRLTASTRSRLTLASSVEAIAEQAHGLVACRAAFVTLELPAGRRLTAWYPSEAMPAGVVAALSTDVGRRDAARLWSGDAADTTVSVPDGVSSLLVVPVRVRDAAHGAVGLVDKLRGSFGAPERKLAVAIAEHAGAHFETVMLNQEALEQVRLTNEMELAAEVQRHLMPRRLPDLGGLGVEVFSASRPALLVGGDFCDVVHEPGRPLWLMVGDASGKGLSAALIMAMTRTAVRSRLAATPPPAPSEVAAGCNADLFHDFTEVGTFTSLFLARCDTGCRGLIMANAGHAPVIFRPADRRAQLLPTGGPPLGFLRVNAVEEQSLPLATGDVLVAATDGFSEARDPDGRLLGIEPLLEWVDALARQPAGEIGRALFDRAEAYDGGTPQTDDRTLIVLKVVDV